MEVAASAKGKSLAPQSSIVAILSLELGRFIPTGQETLSNALRCAAWFIHDDFPTATVSDFTAAAVSLGIDRSTAANRWREAMRNLYSTTKEQQ